MKEADEREREKQCRELQQWIPWLLVGQAFIQEMKRLTSPLCDRARHTRTHCPDIFKPHAHKLSQPHKLMACYIVVIIITICLWWLCTHVCVQVVRFNEFTISVTQVFPHLQSWNRRIFSTISWPSTCRQWTQTGALESAWKYVLGQAVQLDGGTLSSPANYFLNISSQVNVHF